MTEHLDMQWGELRSAVHSPSPASWDVIARSLTSEHPEHQALCAYAAPLVERWPWHIARPVPMSVLAHILAGHDPPSWVMRACNALHLVKHRRASHDAGWSDIGHVRGLLREDFTARLGELLGALAGLQCVSMKLQEFEWGESETRAVAPFLEAQDDLRVLSLAQLGLGKHAFARMYDAGALAHLEQLYMDENHIGRRGVKQVLSSTTRWSDRPVRRFSWTLASFGSGELTRLVRTPWFGDLECLSMRHNVLRAEGLLAWQQAQHAPGLKELDVHVELDEVGSAQFAGLGFLARLERLDVHDSAALNPRASLSGEAFARLIHDSIWCDTLGHLTLRMARAIDSFDAFEARRLPDSLRIVDLRVRYQSAELEPVCERMSQAHPGVIFRVGNRAWSKDDKGEWAWRYDGTPSYGNPWWREMNG